MMKITDRNSSIERIVAARGVGASRPLAPTCIAAPPLLRITGRTIRASHHRWVYLNCTARVSVIGRNVHPNEYRAFTSHPPHTEHGLIIPTLPALFKIPHTLHDPRPE